MKQIDVPDRLKEILKSNPRTAVLTGAGISAESGIPTFREAQTGLWAQYEPERLATPQAFAADPKLVWEWYSWRRELVGNAQPNPGHYALAEMEAILSDFVIITQNVDGFHRLAGNRQVIELHGNIGRVKCFDADHLVTNWAELSGTPPSCPDCGSLLRPDVVWFGEGLPSDGLMEAIDRSRRAELFFSIGTSGMVQPAASLAVEAIKNRDCVVVEINLDVTPISPFVDFQLTGPSGEILPQLAKLLEKR